MSNVEAWQAHCANSPNIQNAVTILERWQAYCANSPNIPSAVTIRKRWQAYCANRAKLAASDNSPNIPSAATIRAIWDQILGPPEKKIKTRKPKVTLDRVMKQANKAGIAVSGVTLHPDGSATLQFGEPQQSNGQPNPWDSVK
jgi:hypothetical protein